MLSRESDLERMEMQGDLLDRSYRCRRMQLTRIFNRQRLELLRIKRDILDPLYSTARRAYFKRRYQLDDLLEIEGELEHTREDLEFLSDRMLKNTHQQAPWQQFNPPILDVDLAAVLAALEQDDTLQVRARLQQEILQHHRRARRDDDRLGLYVRANSDQVVPGMGDQTEVVVGLRFTVPLGNRGDDALPYYVREIQERSSVDQWKQQSGVKAAYLELREQLRRTLRQRDRFERSLERLRRSIAHHHLTPEDANLRAAVKQSRTLTESAIELVLAKEELLQRVNEILRKADLDFAPEYLRPVADNKPSHRSRHGQRSIYLWSSAFNDLENTLLLDFLETKGIRHLLVSAGRRTDRGKLSRLLAEAGQRRIRISLVLGVNKWILPNRRANALEAVAQAAAVHSDVHLDVEPQAMTGFKSDRERHLRQYLDLLADVRLHLGEDVRLSVAVPVNWDQSKYREIAALADELYLMAYGSSKPDTIARRTRPALDAVEHNKLTLVLRIPDFSDEWTLEQTIDALHQRTGVDRYGIHQLSQFLTLARGIR